MSNYRHVISVTVSAMVLVIASAGDLRAQVTVLFEEDFSAGFPSGWSTEDTSANQRLWSHCADPNDVTPAPPGGIVGCHRVWDDVLNLQGPFSSTTAINGFMTVDSDAAGNTNHVSRLTSPALDFTDASAVFLVFEAHIGVFNLHAEQNAIVQVSADAGASWIDFVAFPGLTAGSPDPPFVRWSYNPSRVGIDISALAAGQPTVYIRWQWTANYEFHWAIDDVMVFDGDPTAVFADGFELGDTSWWSSTVP